MPKRLYPEISGRLRLCPNCKRKNGKVRKTRVNDEGDVIARVFKCGFCGHEYSKKYPRTLFQKYEPPEHRLNGDDHYARMLCFLALGVSSDELRYAGLCDDRTISQLRKWLAHWKKKRRKLITEILDRLGPIHRDTEKELTDGLYVVCEIADHEHDYNVIKLALDELADVHQEMRAQANTNRNAEALDGLRAKIDAIRSQMPKTSSYYIKGRRASIRPFDEDWEALIKKVAGDGIGTRQLNKLVRRCKRNNPLPEYR